MTVGMHPGLRFRERRRLLPIAVLTAVAAFAFQLIVQNAMRAYAIDGLYFQGWSSEDFTQTVPIQDLRDAPLQTLLNIHIQPPALDLLRTIFVQFSPNKDIAAALRDVDMRLQLLWAIVYSLTGALVFF